LTKSWVSGGRSGEHVERLRGEISELEARRDELLEKHKRTVFDWASFALGSKDRQGGADSLWDHPATREIQEIISNYEMVNQTILDKQAHLNDKLDEQAKLDSLG
jgi:hypothetical protein